MSMALSSSLPSFSAGSAFIRRSSCTFTHDMKKENVVDAETVQFALRSDVFNLTVLQDSCNSVIVSPLSRSQVSYSLKNNLPCPSWAPCERSHAKPRSQVAAILIRLVRSPSSARPMTRVLKPSGKLTLFVEESRRNQT